MVINCQKNIINVENNLLGGGTEDGMAEEVRKHSKDIAYCSSDPGSASCQKGLAMQNALMVALTAGLGGGCWQQQLVYVKSLACLGNGGNYDFWRSISFRHLG